MADDIERWDGHALEKLMQRGSMTVGELMESVESDQFGSLIAEAWVAYGLERGLIAKRGRLERVDSLQHRGRWPERGGRSDRTLRCQ